MQIVIVAAGRGTRFQGYSNIPKPFMKIHNKPMWQHAMSPWLAYGSSFTTVFNQLHQEHFEKPEFNSNQIWIDRFTDGAAETAYLATEYLNFNEPVCFVDSDGVIEFTHWDYSIGGTFVIEGNSPQHSFVRLDGDQIVEVAEKQVISSTVNTGHYWWESVAQYRQVFEHAKKHDLRTRNEFYMSPMYNIGIEMGYKFKVQRAQAWHCWGTPADLEKYLTAK